MQIIRYQIQNTIYKNSLKVFITIITCMFFTHSLLLKFLSFHWWMQMLKWASDINYPFVDNVNFNTYNDFNWLRLIFYTPSNVLVAYYCIRTPNDTEVFSLYIPILIRRMASCAVHCINYTTWLQQHSISDFPFSRPIFRLIFFFFLFVYYSLPYKFRLKKKKWKTGSI